MKRFNRWASLMTPRVRQFTTMYGTFIDALRIRQHASSDGRNAIALNGVPPAFLEPLCAGTPFTPKGFLDLLALTYQRAGGDKLQAVQQLLSSWATGGFLSAGIRVYCPSSADFTALTQVEIRIPWREYRQPFESFALVIPDGLFSSPISPDIGEPAVCICRHSTDRRVFVSDLQTVFPDRLGANLFGAHWWAADSDETIESYLNRLPDPDPETDLITPSESQSLDAIKRAAINANILLTCYGSKRLGTSNPEHESRLLASLAKRHLSPAARKANEEALKAMPVIFGLDQHIRVYEQEGRQQRDPSGALVKPHWRRGHWAMQAHGPHHSLRKKIFRAAVMVHADRLSATGSSVRAIYTTPASNLN